MSPNSVGELHAKDPGQGVIGPHKRGSYISISWSFEQDPLQ